MPKPIDPQSLTTAQVRQRREMVEARLLAALSELEAETGHRVGTITPMRDWTKTAELPLTGVRLVLELK